MQDYFITKFLNLKEVSVKNIDFNNKYIKVFIETSPKIHLCPCCGKETSKVHDYRLQEIKDCFYNNKQVLFILKKRRYVCSCGKRFLEKYDFLTKYQRMSKRLISNIINEARDVQSMKKIAKINGVSIYTIMRILNFIQYPLPSLPEVLAIDEFKGNAGGEKFQCILVDGKKNKVLDILKSRHQNKLIDYFKQFPRSHRLKVKFFICDMYTPYVELAKVYFPNAKIIIDKYHFIRQITWAFESVRKELQKTMLPSIRKYYKRSRKLLLKSYDKLKDEDKQAVDIMLLYNDNLRLAYRLKESFYKLCKENKYSLQRTMFSEWLEYAENSNISSFVKCAKTYRNWNKGILNAFKYGYTNGATEGFNNKIKVLKRVSYGVQNFKRFRNRILLTTT